MIYRRTRWAVLAALALGCVALSAEAESWKVDHAHTTVGFTVGHLFTSVQGRFDQFEGTIEFDPANPGAAVVRASVDAGSINTNNQKRDKHLRSPDFFDAATHPKLTFESTGLTPVGDNGGKLAGNLTIHGVTRPVVFDFVYRGQGKDPWGNVRAGFQAKVTIDRKDYGLEWNETLETGGLLVGNEVEIQIEAEGILAE